MVNEGGQDLIKRPVAEMPASPKTEKVTSADLKLKVPELGGTVIVLQRNAKDKDNRKLPEGDPRFGALDAGEAEQTQLESQAAFDELLGNMTDEERKTLDILVVAGDSKLFLPDGRRSEHKRAVETADAVLKGIRKAMGKFSITEQQLLNKEGQSIELSSGSLKDLYMLENSDFVKFLIEKSTKDGVFDEKMFWTFYESDKFAKERMEMKAEGPLDIAKRVNEYMGTVANAMKHYHEKHPGRRVIVWAVSHYDSISPFLKKHVAGMTKQTFLDTYLPVDNRAGVVLNLRKGSLNATAQIKEREYNVSLTGKRDLKGRKLNEQ